MGWEINYTEERQNKRAKEQNKKERKKREEELRNYITTNKDMIIHDQK